MLVIQIALGIVLACVLLQVAPLLVSVCFGAVARSVRVLVTRHATLPPFWRNAANKGRGPNPVWITAMLVAAGAVAVNYLH
jgi:hypothetical protein